MTSFGNNIMRSLRRSGLRKLAHAAQRLRATASFVKGNLWLVLKWPVAALALAAAGWPLLLAHLADARQDREADARHDAGYMAASYAREVERAAELIDQVTGQVKYQWETAHGHFTVADAAGRGDLSDGGALLLAIVDATGTIRSSTLPAAVTHQVTPKVLALLRRHAAGRFIPDEQGLDGARPGKLRLLFFRQLADRAGQFAGAVVVCVPQRYFSDNYDGAMFMRRAFFGLVGADNVPRSASIGASLQTPSQPVLVSPPQLPAARGSALVAGAGTFGDGRSRFVGWQQVHKYGITAMVGLDRDEVLAPYWASRAVILRVAGVATAALGVFALLATLNALRLARRSHQLGLIRSTYRAATEGGNEGFYMLAPVRGQDGRIGDFVVIDCNRPGAELLDQQRSALIGTRVSCLFEPRQLGARLAAMREAMERGYHELMLERPNGHGGVRWVKARMMRSGGALAVAAWDANAEQAHAEELLRVSNEDGLTKLPNRNWIENYLQRTIERANGHQRCFALLFLNLDGFKAINDSWGHAAGDQVLRAAARRLQGALRPHDRVARFGGDEFLVVLEDIADPDEAARASKRILNAFRQVFRLPYGEYTIGASIGISIFPIDGQEAKDLLHSADIVMHAVKTSGKGRYGFCDRRYYDHLRARLLRMHELRQALERDEFVMYYQPRADIVSGRVSSMEALVRWQHPKAGLVMPDKFISLVEESGLVLPMGEVVIDKVCAQIAQWVRDGDEQPVPVSINVSPCQFNRTDIAAVIANALERHGVDPSRIEVELTETSLMNEDGSVLDAVNAIRKMGVRVLVDDFGTGYSSLSQLQRLQFDGLKIDRAFTAQLGKSEGGMVIVGAIITMARALGMHVVAEGVETEEQLALLRTLQCDEVQGFLVSQPLPAGQVRQAVACSDR